jgi:hypothetical protein
MNRNRLTLLTIVLLLILTGIWAYPKIDQFFKDDTCLDKGGSWNDETWKRALAEEVTDSPKTDSLNGYNQLADKQNRQTYTISEYNTDLEAENIDRPEKTVITNPTFDTTHLFKTWTLDPDGPHADFWFNRTEFYVVDYDGNGAMPYILNQDSLTIFYNDFVQKGLIVSISKDTLIIRWDETGKPTEYVEWKN